MRCRNGRGVWERSSSGPPGNRLCLRSDVVVPAKVKALLTAGGDGCSHRTGDPQLGIVPVESKLARRLSRSHLLLLPAAATPAVTTPVAKGGPARAAAAAPVAAPAAGAAPRA